MRILWQSGTAAGHDDAELLRRFVGGGNPAAENAFRVLLDRHGPLVQAVCRSVLKRPQDADDAFQATFLILVRKAGAIRLKGSLAPWLYAVAHRTALRARAQASRYRPHNHETLAESDEPASEGPAWELRPVLHQELAGLPEKYRAPIVLCHLEGKSHEEAARLLDWPVGTLSGRLSRGRRVLRERLERRGLGSAGILAAPASGAHLPAVTARLGTDTLKLALAGGNTVPGHLSALIPGVMNAMFQARLSHVLLAVASIGAASLPLALRPIWLPWLQGETSTAPTHPAVIFQQRATTPPPEAAGAFVAGGGRSMEAAMMAGMMGMAPAPLKNSPNMAEMSEPVLLLRMGPILLTETADGKALAAMHTQADDLDWIRYELPPGVSVTPVVNSELATFMARGDVLTEVAAFSAQTREWAIQRLVTSVKEQITPAVGTGVALFQEGNNFYAFSASAGKWGVLQLEGPEPPRAAINQTDITVQQGNRVYVFSPISARWSKGIAAKAPAQPEGGGGMMMMPGPSR